MENYEIDNRAIFQLFISEHLDEMVRQIRCQFLYRKVYIEDKKDFYYTVKKNSIKEEVEGCYEAGHIYKKFRKYDNYGNKTFFYNLSLKQGEIIRGIDYNVPNSDFVYKVNDTYYQVLITLNDKNNTLYFPEDYFYELSKTYKKDSDEEDVGLKAKLWDSAVTFMAILSHASMGRTNALRDMIDSMKSIMSIASNPLRFCLSLGHQYTKYVLDAFNIKGLKMIDGKLTPSYEYADLLNALNEDYLSRKSGDNWDQESGKHFYAILKNHKVARNREAHGQPYYYPEEIIPSLTYFIYDCIILVYFLKHVCGLKNQDNILERYFVEFYPQVRPAGEDIVIENAEYNGISYYLRNFDTYKACYNTSKGEKDVVRVPDYKHLNYKIVPNDSGSLVILKDQDFSIIAKTNDYVNRMVAMSGEMRNILKDQSSSIDDLREQIIDVVEKKFNRWKYRAVRKKMIELIRLESEENFKKQVAHYREKVLPVLEKINSTLEDLAKSQKESNKWIYKTFKFTHAAFIGIKGIAGSLKETNNLIHKNIKYSRATFWLELLGLIVSVVSVVFLAIQYYTKHESPKTILEEENLAYERALNLENVIIKSNVKDNNSKGLFLLAKSCSVPVLMYEANRNYRDAIDKYTRIIDDNSVNNSEEDTTKVELARRLARIYMFGKGGVFDPDLALKYANLANEKGRYNQGLYLITYGLKNKFSDYVVCQIDQAFLYGTIDTKDPYLPLMIQIREIETLNNGDDPDRENKIYDIVKNIKERKYDNPDVRHAALLYTLKLDANGLTDSLGNITYHRDLYNAVNTAEILSDELNSLGAQLWLGTTMEELRNPTAVNYYLLAAYNGSISGFYSALSYAEEQKEFMTAHPLLAKELGRNNDIGKLIWLRKYISDGKWTLVDSCLTDLKRGLSDKSLKLGNNVIPQIEKLITLHTPWKAKMLREKIDTARLSPKCIFLNDVADSLRRSAAIAYVDGMFYAEGLGDRQKDQIKADSLFRYAASLGMEDAAHTLGVRLINRHERREAEELLTPFFDSSDRMRILASQFYRLSDNERSQRYLSAVKDSLNLYKNIAAAYAYLDKPGRSTHNDSLMYHRILDSWDIMDGNPAWITDRVLFLLGRLSDNNPSRQDSYRKLWISHFVQSTLISTGVDLPEELIAQLNNYYSNTGNADPIYSFFALCNNKDKESAFNRLNQIGILNSALPDALAWLIEINKVTRNEVADTKSVLFTMPRILTNAPWHSVMYPYPTYTDLNTIFQLN